MSTLAIPLLASRHCSFLSRKAGNQILRQNFSEKTPEKSIMEKEHSGDFCLSRQSKRPWSNGKKRTANSLLKVDLTLKNKTGEHNSKQNFQQQRAALP